MDILGESEILLGTYEAFVLGYKLVEDAVRSGHYIPHLSVSILQKEYVDSFAWRATHELSSQLALLGKDVALFRSFQKLLYQS